VLPTYCHIDSRNVIENEYIYYFHRLKAKHTVYVQVELAFVLNSHLLMIQLCRKFRKTKCFMYFKRK
jgi:hypothetical protein